MFDVIWCYFMLFDYVYLICAQSDKYYYVPVCVYIYIYFTLKNTRTCIFARLCLMLFDYVYILCTE